MKVFIIGGTGLLGSAAADILIARGDEVSTLALPPLPPGAPINPKMKVHFGNYMELSDEELAKYMEGCEGFIFAAGVDDRVTGPRPVYDLYEKYNTEPTERLLKIAKQSGVKHAVILGSYFTHFDRIHPEWELSKWNPYIRSRVHQQEVALSEAAEGFDVAVLGLPYIFGTQPGRKPVWTILCKNILSMKKKTMWPKGGTTMVTVRQVGEATVGALDKNEGGHFYPIGYYNMEWTRMLKLFHKAMGCPDKPIKIIPNWMFAMGGKMINKKNKKAGIEAGLNMAKFSRMMCSNAFIEPSLGCLPLGVTGDDIEKAIEDSIKLSMLAIEGKVEGMVEMKAE